MVACDICCTVCYEYGSRATTLFGLTKILYRVIRSVWRISQDRRRFTWVLGTKMLACVVKAINKIYLCCNSSSSIAKMALKSLTSLASTASNLLIRCEDSYKVDNVHATINDKWSLSLYLSVALDYRGPVSPARARADQLRRVEQRLELERLSDQRTVVLGRLVQHRRGDLQYSNMKH